MVLKLFYNDWAKNAMNALNDAHYVLKIEAKINWKLISCAVQECCWPRDQTKIWYFKLCLTHKQIRAKKQRGKQRETGYRPLGKLFLFVFFLACFLALIAWHWQQAACSDTHWSNESRNNSSMNANRCWNLFTNYIIAVSSASSTYINQIWYRLNAIQSTRVYFVTI